MPKRGRTPNKYMRVLKLLEPCQGYEKGITIDDIAIAMYERSDFHTKAMARQLIGGARRLTRKLGIKADLASISLVGAERRYCHLNTVAEYGKAIIAFE